METFWLCHLADCWNGRKKVPVPPAALVAAPSTGEVVPPPLATSPVTPTASHAVPESPATSTVNALAGHDTVIRAAAAQMVFASRTSQDFITPVQVAALEEWTGKVRSTCLVPYLPWA
jgi:uridine phosphorylase